MALLRSLRWPLLALVLVLGSLGTRATVEQRRAYARAVALEQQGRSADAVDEYRWALRWYTPWGPDWSDAAAALLDIGERASAADPELAVQAFDSLRSGLIASRSLWQPRNDLVARCNRTLPGLLVRVADRRGDKRDPKVLLARFAADYARPVGVSPWTSLAVVLGFVLWLSGLVLAVWRGVDAQGHWLPAGWRWLGSSIAGFALWVLALWRG